MIADLLKKGELATLTHAWRDMVAKARAGMRNGDAQALKAAAKYGWKEEELVAFEQLLMEAEKGFAHGEDGTYITPDDALSFVQTLLEDAYMEAGMVEESAGQGIVGEIPAVTNRTLKLEAKPSAGQSLFSSAFDEPNPRFITEGAKAVAWRMIHGKVPFRNTPPQFQLADRARFVVVGDWGTGIKRADVISKLMRDALQEANGRQGHAVHLGDIYFSGWPKEAKERFLDHWPIKEGETFAHSWCINGNHDMYCGGQGYFEVVLGDARFKEQGGCSYFCLENDHWQILGLDTAYEEWVFSHGQLAWALDQRARSPQKKGMLLTHHQPFSDYEKSGKSEGLANQAAPLLVNGTTTAWLWGHEHRGVVYKPKTFTFPTGSHGRLPFGACIGHGGVPARPTKALPSGSGTSMYALTEIVRSGIEKFGMFGFGILDIDGASATLVLVDEKGRKTQPFVIA